jgi:hypothetical protein
MPPPLLLLNELHAWRCCRTAASSSWHCCTRERAAPATARRTRGPRRRARAAPAARGPAVDEVPQAPHLAPGLLGGSPQERGVKIGLTRNERFLPGLAKHGMQEGYQRLLRAICRPRGINRKFRVVTEFDRG